ncbi:MAG TPA: endolytic transglycosylase MltG [Dongiaceae bacterium]|nr:endolytic transglycosylase MltG [Dongiaceae bacterium]
MLTLYMAVLVLALVGVIGLFYLHFWGETPMPVTETTVVEVEPGSSVYRLAQQLEDRQLVNSAFVFRLYGRLRQLTGIIHSGEYELTPGMTPADLYRNLANGVVLQYTVTLVDGQTIEQFRKTLQSTPKLVYTLDKTNLADVARAWGASSPSLEGMFYPDTYVFRRGDSDVSVLQRAYQRMQQQLDDAWTHRAPDLPYRNSYEALIMASIVEKETGVADERPLIAGVFVNRLRKSMRLQTDPTVIYGMGERYNGNITKNDLLAYSPYNTYAIDGLPPTPIANPGRAAIEAALHPAPTDALYFVAKGDGSHHFSTTLEAHEKAVQEFQMKRRSDYRSTTSP